MVVRTIWRVHVVDGRGVSLLCIEHFYSSNNLGFDSGMRTNKSFKMLYLVFSSFSKVLTYQYQVRQQFLPCSLYVLLAH